MSFSIEVEAMYDGDVIEVDVETSDVLEALDDDDLISELEYRGYVVWTKDVDEVLTMLEGLVGDHMSAFERLSDYLDDLDPKMTGFVGQLAGSREAMRLLLQLVSIIESRNLR